MVKVNLVDSKNRMFIEKNYREVLNVLKNKIIFPMVLVVIIALSFSFSVNANETVLNLGNVQPPGHVYNQAIDYFAELVEEKTNGSVKIQVHPDALLGSNPAMMDSVYAGTIEMGQFPPGTLGEYFDPINLFSFYYLFENFDDMVSTLEEPAVKTMEEDFLEETGVRILWYAGGLERNIITANDPIYDIEDLEGLTMRAWEWDPAVQWWEDLGAAATIVAYDEVYTGLQTGVVDGAENEFSAFDADGWAEISDYIARTRHIFTIRPVIINNEAFENLTDEEQEAILEAGTKAQDYQMELSREENDKLAEVMVDEYGIEITEPNPEPFRDISLNLLADYAERYGFADYIEELFGITVE